VPSGQEIMVRVGVLLQDVSHVRWPLTELRDWINEGVKATILAKPSASSAPRVLTLAEGTLQQIPQSGTPLPLALLSVVRNIVTTSPLVAGRIITPTTHQVLNAQIPNWHDNRFQRFTKEVRHVVFDEQVPTHFYVFPGNDGTGKIEANLSVLPAPLAATGAVDAEASYAAQIGLSELYTPVIVDYVCYRAHSKDDLAGNAGRAMTHFQAFAAAVGLKTQVEAATGPNARRGT
jgi:hypothetical protein